MRVDAHIPRRSAQTLPLSIRYMLLRFRIPVLLCHAKVDDVNNVGSLGGGSTDQEVVGLDVAVDQVLLMNGLHSRELTTSQEEEVQWCISILSPNAVEQRRRARQSDDGLRDKD